MDRIRHTSDDKGSLGGQREGGSRRVKAGTGSILDFANARTRLADDGSD